MRLGDCVVCFNYSASNKVCYSDWGDKVIRPKPDDRINKTHMTEYLVPYDRTIKLKITIWLKMKEVISKTMFFIHKLETWGL